MSHEKMTTKRYTSFVLGVVITSITWIFSLYLYSKLSQNANAANPTVFEMGASNSVVEESVFYQKSNNLQDLIQEDKKFEKYNKNDYNKNKINQEGGYINSEKLIKQLQPVPVRATVTVEKGLNELGMVKSVEEQIKRDEGYKHFAFNVLVSENLSLHREIPDTRHQMCQNQTYPLHMPNASIVICFYNEHFTTLLRSLHSIIDKTPSALLHEIILVNDYSDSAELHKDIEEYIKKYFNDKVKYFKTDRREGLIRARMFGARMATGSVLIFLDSHIEVNKMWIEPLLSRISTDKTVVTMPVIDIINADTFQYSSSPLVRGGFNWGLHFKWDNLPIGTLKTDEDFVKPIRSPTMAGGLFAMNRDYFNELGEYDAGMEIWGGENLEISFRIWMCGGRLELLPCSRIGHVFRRRRPYGNEDQRDTMLRNSLRVAHVWMDDYKDYFLKHVKKIDYGDISSRIALRKRLQCKDFDWYLKTIYPELALPDDNEKQAKNKWAKLNHLPVQPWHSRKRNYTDQYQIRLTNTSLCIQAQKDIKTKGSKLKLAPCLRIKSQMWYETDKRELVLGQMLCLEAKEFKLPVLGKCHEMGGNQEWQHKGVSQTPIYNVAMGTCLGTNRANNNFDVIMTLCTNEDKSSISWDLVRAKFPFGESR